MMKKCAVEYEGETEGFGAGAVPVLNNGAVPVPNNAHHESTMTSPAYSMNQSGEGIFRSIRI